MTDTVSQPTAISRDASHAYALRVIAEALRDLPDPFDVWLCIQPVVPTAPHASNRERVDTLALALLGEPGKDHNGIGKRTRQADGRVGPVRVSITAAVPAPPDERDLRIAELERQLAEAKGAA